MKEIVSESSFLFHTPETYDQELVLKKWDEQAVNAISGFKDALIAFDGEFTAHNIKESLSATMESIGIKMGKIMQALRLALTGEGHGPDLMVTMEILGKDEVVKRLDNALTRLPAQIRLA